MDAAIPQDDKQRKELIDLGKKRYRISRAYFSPKHEIWVRCYKIYRALADAVDDKDEVNLFIPYAFGLIEDIVSRLTEPILQKLPVRAQARSPLYTKAARNFYGLVRNYFATSRYQQDLTDSYRQMIITGNAWEKDEWANEWVEGKEWALKWYSKAVETVGTLLGKAVPMKFQSKFQKLVEVAKLYPKSIGYRTRFPSVFLVWPEPGVKRVEDMHWIVEEEESVSIDDLRKQVYKDADGVTRPVYDLTELDRDYKNRPPGSLQPEFEGSSPYHKEIAAVLGSRAQVSAAPSTTESDMDKGHLLHVNEPGRMWTILNGKYLVKHIDKPWHRPRLPYRLRIYTPDPENLLGLGAIEPCEDLFLELNDTHRLAMRAWLRMVSGMIAYHKGAVPFPDDWKPKSGGRIRIDPGISPNIQNAIMALKFEDPTNGMLTHESNMKGLLERVTSMADLSPGAEGTKQYHKTATGLLEIQNQLAKRFATMRRAQMANYQEQMGVMYDFCMQFMFEAQPARMVNTDGKTLYPKFARGDIWTNGEGFDFVIEEDPSFGDDVIQRNQLVFLLDQGIKYEIFRMNSKDPTILKLKVSNIMKRMIEAFGWTFNAELLGSPDGVLSPDAELEMILNGVDVQPQLKENLVGHVIDHIVQLMSPKLTQGAASGQISPEVIGKLKEHISETTGMIQMVMSNPQAAAGERIKEVMQGVAQAGGPPGAMPKSADLIPPVAGGAPGSTGGQA